MYLSFPLNDYNSVILTSHAHLAFAVQYHIVSQFCFIFSRLSILVSTTHKQHSQIVLPANVFSDAPQMMISHLFHINFTQDPFGLWTFLVFFPTTQHFERAV